MKKRISILLVLAMVLSMIPMAAFAASVNSVDRVVTVNVPNELGSGILTIAEQTEFVDDFQLDDEFEVILPSGTEWPVGPIGDETNLSALLHASSTTDAVLTRITARTMHVKITSLAVTRDILRIDLSDVKVNSGSGELKLQIRNINSSVSDQEVAFARAVSGSTTTTVESLKTFDRTTTLGAIRIQENAAGTITSTAVKTSVDPAPETFEERSAFTLTLPVGFTWDTTDPANVVGTGGLNGVAATANITPTSDPREIIVTVRQTPVTPRTIGSLFLSNLKVRADRDASYGDIDVRISGSNMTTATIVVGTYKEFGGAVAVAEVKELVAGRNEATPNRTARITITEQVAGSFIPGREVEVVLPTWVSIVGSPRFHRNDSASIEIASNKINFNSQRNAMYLEMPAITTSARKLDFDVVLSIEPDATGEIEAIIKGAGVPESKLVIAKAVAPVTVQSGKTDLRIGVQNQEVKNITITETGTGRIARNQALTVALTDGVRFSTVPTVKVTKGDGKLDRVRLVGGALELTFSSASSRTPMEIEVSNIKASVDRNVVEGTITAEVGGAAIARNAADWDNLLVVTEFEFGRVITPAPGDVRATAEFKIGQNSYAVIQDGVRVEKALDVAPFINAQGRTMLPVRYVADALGVSENNIIWNDATRTVTILKGNLVAQMKIDSNILTVNGVQITMDTTAQIVNGRTVLPLRFAAQALGAEIEWDGNQQLVTVRQ